MLNRGYAFSSTIGGERRGEPLLQYLAECYAHSSVEQWRERIDGGEVLLDGVAARGDAVLGAGQVVVWNRPPWEEPEAPRQFDVLFEDEVLVALGKPCGLPTLPGAGYLENTLLHAAQQRFPGANPVHRLGRATTGVVLFAKTAAVATKLVAGWHTPEFQKIYYALGSGMAAQNRYEIATPIGRVPHPQLGTVWAAKAGGKPSRSVAEVVQVGRATTLFRVSLFSGRPHQIRIHLASIGHALVGDPLYGPGGLPLEKDPGLPGDGGYLLHAHQLRFVHPLSGKNMCIEAALPASFARFLKEKDTVR